MTKPRQAPRFRHTDRPGFLMGFVDFFTAGLFFLFYMPLSGLQDELDAVTGRKTMRYWKAYLLGIPTLFQDLAKQGWDVWVYTASYYSTDYLRRLFRLWGCPVTGVITGTGRKIQGAEEAKRTLSKMFEEKYRCTVHIDNETVLQTFARSEAFREEPIDASREPWAPAVLSALRRLPEEE